MARLITVGADGSAGPEAFLQPESAYLTTSSELMAFLRSVHSVMISNTQTHPGVFTSETRLTREQLN